MGYFLRKLIRNCSLPYSDHLRNFQKLSTAINVFLKESIRKGGFPFDVCLQRPNMDTLSAMLESDKLLHDPDAKKYELEDALKELKK